MSQSHLCPRACLRLVELETRLAPAVFDVTLHGPAEGITGTTDAAHSGGLAVTGGTPQAAGTARVTAASPALAVRAALSGSVQVTLGGQTTTYTFGPTTASGDRAAHAPYFVALPDGRTGFVRLEDLAGTPSQADWDYNDRAWRVGVRPVDGLVLGGGGGLEPQGGDPTGGDPPASPFPITGTATLTDFYDQTATVAWAITQPAPDRMHWSYTLLNHDIHVKATNNKGVVAFAVGGQPAAYRNPYTSLSSWASEPHGPAWLWSANDDGLMPGASGTFEFDTDPQPVVDVEAVAHGVARYPTMALGTVMGPAALKIDILGADGNVTDHADVSRWEGAFTAAGVTASKDFHKTDGQRVSVRIEDQTRAGKNGVAATITALLRTLDIETDQADIVRNFELKEQQAGSGVFYSEPFVMVSNKKDDEFQAANVADGNPKDPTLNVFKPQKLTAKPLSILVGGTLEARYDPQTGAAPAADDGGAVGRVNIGKDIRKVRVRPIILKTAPGAVGQPAIATSEVLEDFALMNVAWAQANIRVVPTGDPILADPPGAEPYQDIGYDHDGNPATPNAGAGNGQWDWIDTNGDRLHQTGEPSEPYTNSNANKGAGSGLWVGTA